MEDNMLKKKIGIFFFVSFIIFFAVNFRQRRLDRNKDHKPESRQTRLRHLHRRSSLQINSVKYAPDQILVKFKPSLSIQARDTTIQAYKAKSLRQIPKIDVYQLQIPESVSVEEMLYVLSLNPDIEYAEPNYIFRLCVTPNDFFFRYQYALSNTSQRVAPIDIPGAPTGISKADIKATTAWEETKGTEDIIIAIIDTGVDIDHRDIKNKLVSSGKDYVNGDDEADDDHGHGTNVAGIAAAETNNDEGIAGVAWNCKILPIKVFDKNENALSTDIADAITWAADQGAHVINMSFGGSIGFGKNVSQTVEDALEYAYNKDVILVAAAGNDGIEGVVFPASSSYTLAVTATDSQDRRTSWSSHGPEVDVAAPGDWIVSLYPEDLSRGSQPRRS